VQQGGFLHNDFLSPLFMAAIEATEEAIINSLFAAVTTLGFNGSKVEALPLNKALPLLEAYNRIMCQADAGGKKC
jgi:D-aminopeptidase